MGVGTMWAGAGAVHVVRFGASRSDRVMDATIPVGERAR